MYVSLIYVVSLTYPRVCYRILLLLLLLSDQILVCFDLPLSIYALLLLDGGDISLYVERFNGCVIQSRSGCNHYWHQCLSDLCSVVFGYFNGYEHLKSIK